MVGLLEGLDISLIFYVVDLYDYQEGEQTTIEKNPTYWRQCIPENEHE